MRLAGLLLLVVACAHSQQQQEQQQPELMACGGYFPGPSIQSGESESDGFTIDAAEGVAVELDGEPIAPGKTVIAISPGVHEIVAKDPKRGSTSLRFIVKEGEHHRALVVR
jgi:hypothetical protein